jgi:cell division protein FtsW
MSMIATDPSAAPTEEAPAPVDEAPERWDWPLLGFAGTLAGFGLLMILSASSLDADATYGNALHFVTRQGIGLVVGVVAATVLMIVPWSWVRRAMWPAYGVTLASLLLVLTPLGHSAKGATRWIRLGPINIQPSEFAKVVLVGILAHYLAANRGRLKDAVGVGLPGIGLLAPLIVLIIFQKDFGTTVILLGLAGVLYFVAGLQWRWVASGIGGAFALLAGLVIIEPYRIRRLTSFTDPFADPDGAGYQVVQGWIALATGGWFGAGLATGVAQRGFLPEAHTDFIVAVIGEELGAAGWALTMLLLLGVVWRGSVIARRAPDLFGMLVAVGITTMFAAQAIINVGVVGGVLPAKGLVLPFLSYGASAVVVHTLCVGVLLRISLEAARATRADRIGEAPPSTEG